MTSPVTSPANSCKVIAISGLPGSGKTAVTRALVEHFAPEACAVFLDAYEPVAEYFPRFRSARSTDDKAPDLRRRWIKAGGSVDDFVRIPRQAADLARLKKGKRVKVPEPKNTPWPERDRVAPKPLVFLDDMFGRSRKEIDPYIDFSVFLEAPLDLAFARRILRAFAEDRNPEKLAWQYLQPAYRDGLVVIARGCDHADLVIDATPGLDEVAHAAVRSVGDWVAAAELAAVPADARPGLSP